MPALAPEKSHHVRLRPVTNDPSGKYGEHDDETAGPWASAGLGQSATAPGPVKAVVAASGGSPGKVVVTWPPPGSDGGAAITQYEVEVIGASGGASGESVTTVTAGSNLNKTTVTAPPGAGPYQARVRAVNGMGRGAWASGDIGQTGTTPGPVRNLTAVGGNKKITVTWDPPANAADANVTSYVVQYLQQVAEHSRPDNSANGWKDAGEVHGSVREFTISSLKNSHSHYRTILEVRNGKKIHILIPTYSEYYVRVAAKSGASLGTYVIQEDKELRG